MHDFDSGEICTVLEKEDLQLKFFERQEASVSSGRNTPMKHPFFSLLSASLLLGSLAVGTVVSAIPAAADGTSGDYTYEVDEETLKGYITGYTGKDKEITIPEELDGTVIAGISADTFYNCDTLEKITIPASITEIGESAFYDCDNLKEFAVADDSETYYAKDGVLFRTKDDCLMAYPPAATATSYTVPDGCKELYYAAFGKCNNLEEITLPDSLLYIDDWVFAYDNIDHIAIPDSVVEICDYAFAYCVNLKKVSIGKGAFKTESFERFDGFEKISGNGFISLSNYIPKEEDYEYVENSLVLIKRGKVANLYGDEGNPFKKPFSCFRAGAIFRGKSSGIKGRVLTNLHRKKIIQVGIPFIVEVEL